MKTLGVVLLWVGLFIVLALISWGVVLYFGWPLWMVAALVAGSFGLYFLGRFAWRMVVLMRSRSRLARSSAVLNSDAPAAVSGEKLLAGKWKAAVATLRQSSLRRSGNPLYVLPWFMIIGQPGTGKTTALTRARLSSPIQKISQNAEIVQTADCDWWYFDRAVVIDCAGRYVDAQNAQQDRREWEVGLDLLGRYRARAGLDGLVLAVSADRLLAPDQDAMADEGRVVRARIDQLIQMFGKRFPIYVLVTKCDLLYGFEAWTAQLPSAALSQAMGYMADECAEGETAFVAQAFDSIAERLHQLRAALVVRNVQASPELLLFPNELDRLRAGLALFLRACLADSPYLERPLLRGLFFSSGLQEGGAVSSVLGQALPPVPRHPGAAAGLFLHDVFGQILPEDRFAAKPAMLVNRWRAVTQNLGMAAWILVLVALGVILSLSFVGNMRTLQIVRAGQSYDAPLTGGLEQDCRTLLGLDDVLTQVEHNDRHWLSHWVGGSTGVSELEAQLRQRFVERYRRSIQPMTDQNARTVLASAAASDTVGARAQLILNLARSVALLQARIDGAGRAELDAMPQLAPTSIYTSKLSQQLNQLAVSHLTWSRADDAYLRERLNAERALLDQQVFADPQMTWLVGLVPDDGAIAPVRANDFWGDSILPADARDWAGTASVPAAYTEAGRQALERLVTEIRASVSDVVRFDIARASFDGWYRGQQFKVWHRFADTLADARQTFARQADSRDALGVVAGAQSPYYRVVARLAEEFGNLGEAQLPGWLLVARRFQQLRGQVAFPGAANQAVKVAGAINAVGGAALKQALSGAPRQGGRTVSENLAAVDALTLYLGELGKLAAAGSAGSGKDYQLAADFHQYATSPQSQPSAIQSTLAPLDQLQRLIGSGDASDALIWRLVRGPLDFLVTYIEQQASCELQKSWQSSVLWPLQGVTDQAAMTEQLFGAKGAVWAFADGPAKPFLLRNASRYEIVQTQGYSVPFAPAFLPMLNGALGRQVAQQAQQQRSEAEKASQQLQAQQAQLQAQQTLDLLDKALAEAKERADAARAETVPLTVNAQPTDVNAGAKSRPFATVLTLQCAAGAQVINNYNFPVSGSIAWAAGQCSDVGLQIRIGTLVLNRKYAGPLGVAAFLRDFRSGEHVFVPADFPADQAGLRGLGIEHISVRYAFDGSDAVLNAADRIERYDALRKTTAQQKQQIQEEQLQRQQQSVAQQLAERSAQSAAPTIGVPNTPNFDMLALPQTIGACWRSDAPAVHGAPQSGGI